MLLSLQGNLPAWVAVTEAHFPDQKAVDQLPILAGAYQVLDRGHLDFIRLFRLHHAGAWFVVRNQHPVQYRGGDSRPGDQRTGRRWDQTIQLTSRWSAQSYPERLRRIRVYDAENHGTLVLLSHQFAVPALVMAELYRQRWQVELFFQWIKQPLRIRNCYGRSENAARGQSWSASGAYLLVAIVKKRLELPQSLHEISQIVSVNIFAQLPREELLATTPCSSGEKAGADPIQNLFCFNA